MIFKRLQFSRSPRFFLEFTVWSLFIFSAARTLFVIVETNQIDNPFLFADEWVVSAIITSQPFVDASLAGHGRVPCYIQNALWWMDYTWLGYKGILPIVVQIGGWLLGFIIFSAVLRSARVSRTILALYLSLLLIFWFSLPNAEQYSFYRWRGVEASLIFLFLSVTLYFIHKFCGYQKGSTRTLSSLAFVAAILSSWIALYVHGGFPLLPITLIILMLSATDRKLYTALGAALLTLFIWHFLKIHYTPTLKVQSGVGAEEITLGFLIVLSSLPYALLKPVVGQQVALSFAGIIGLSALGILGALIVRLIRKKTTTIDIIALFFLAYPIAIALSITQVRIHVYGWEYALSGRYANYSIYVLLGIMLYAIREIPHNRRSILPSAIAFFSISPVIVLGTLSLGKTIKDTESIRAEELKLQAQMVPYTLKPWLFPPRPHFTEVRKKGGQKIHDTLLEHSANVFGSLPYQTYSVTERTPVSEKHLPGCFKRIQIVQKDFIQEGLLLEIFLALEEPWSKVEGSVLFITLPGTTAGWAVRQGCIGCFWQDITGHEHRLQEIQGYMILEIPPFSARAVLVNKVGEAVCVSDNIEF